MTYLTTTEAGTIARVGRRTIVRWIHKDKFKAVKLPGKGGDWRINETEFMEFLRGLRKR